MRKRQKKTEANRELLFSVTKKDLTVTTFRGSGPGGQHRNKTDSGVRIVHEASGAVGEAQERRSQGQNKRQAFRRLIESKKFKAWHRLRCGEALVNKQAVEAAVERQMLPHNLKVEVVEDGKWAEE